MKQTKSNVRSSWQQHDTVYWRLYEGTHQRYNAYSRSEQSTENSVTMKSQATVVITVTDRQTHLTAAASVYTAAQCTRHTYTRHTTEGTPFTSHQRQTCLSFNLF